jgi:hypothetical protein
MSLSSLLPPVLAGGALAFALVRVLRAFRARGAALEQIHGALRRRELTLEGDLTRDEEPLELKGSGGAVARQPEALPLGAVTPKAAPELQSTLLVTGRLDVPDVVVCRHALAQAVFGPFPPPAVKLGGACLRRDLRPVRAGARGEVAGGLGGSLSR